MIGVFYNKSTLNNTLVVNLSDKPIDHISNTDLFSIMYDKENKILGLNILNWNNVYPECPIGFLHLTPNICNFIKIITKIDLFEYLDSNDFVIGQVVKCVEIPNTHLHSTEVNIGSETLNIVCGAKNVREGLKVVVAKIGTILPNGFRIKPSELMGYKSFGMLCSTKELNIQGKFNDQGIIELSDKYKVGSKFLDLFSNK